MSLQQLKARIGDGPLSFPVTPFVADASKVDYDRLAQHIEWPSSHPAAAPFAAGGTGEFFSLPPDEVVQVAKVTKQAAGAVPIVAGCGYGAVNAVDLARRLERAGADALPLLPQYLMFAEQGGLFSHIKQVCDATIIEKASRFKAAA